MARREVVTVAEARHTPRTLSRYFESVPTHARKNFALARKFRISPIASSRFVPQHPRALRGVVPLVTSRNGRPDPLEVWQDRMKKCNGSMIADSSLPLQKLNDYLEKNFPDFFAEARFQVGEDDYFLYARFGQYLARAIEKSRAPRNKINRGFTVLNKMARASAKNPGIRQMLVSGPLEYIVDAPKARALARKRLSPVAQGYLESLCE